MGESQIYEGKVKTVEILNDDEVKITFHDKITAGDGAKKDVIPGKGKLNLDLTELLFSIAEKAGVPNHIINKPADNVIIAKKLKIFPIEVVVRNFIAGSYARRYGIEDGTPLTHPIVEYFVKDDDLHDPPISASIAIAQGLINDEDLTLISSRALQVNTVLFEYFKSAGMKLVDFKLEFGKDKSGDIYLGDELSGDSMRVWDSETDEKLDKDRFRKDLGDVKVGYQAILTRLQEIEYEPKPVSITALITIAPKDGVTNPSGEVTKRALTNSGIEYVGDVVIGKTITVEIEEPRGNNWIHQLHQTANDLLSNPLIEKYTIKYSTN